MSTATGSAAALDATVSTDGQGTGEDDGSKAALAAATEKVKRQKAHLRDAEKALAALKKGN